MAAYMGEANTASVVCLMSAQEVLFGFAKRTESRVGLRSRQPFDAAANSYAV
jgi:hypothetical protein